MGEQVLMVRKKEYSTSSPSQTRALGKKLAQEILKKPFTLYLQKAKDKAFVMGLEGDLGGGKTTFLQGFAKGLGIKKKILSPTFVILKRFKIPTQSNAYALRPKVFIHIDCYRIKKIKELSELGLKEIIASPKNVVAIEWAEKIKEILPDETFWLKFIFKNKTQRKILVRFKE